MQIQAEDDFSLMIDLGRGGIQSGRKRLGKIQPEKLIALERVLGRGQFKVVLDPGKDVHVVIKEGVAVRTGDADVGVLCTAYVAKTFGEETTKHIYVHMELTNIQRIFNIKEMVKGLGVNVFRALSWFHAFAGCDIVSSFYGKGKVKAWDLWMSSSFKQELDKLFIKLGNLPKEITDPDFQLVQRFILDLYKKDITETLSTVRLKMFFFFRH